MGVEGYVSRTQLMLINIRSLCLEIHAIKEGSNKNVMYEGSPHGNAKLAYSETVLILNLNCKISCNFLKNFISTSSTIHDTL
jgi:hypothetical protein